MVKGKKKTSFDRAMEDLSSKVRMALGTMVSENATMFVTPADVAERVMSNYSLTNEEREVVSQRVGGVLSQMYKQGKCNIFRTNHKISPNAVNKKAQFGYRIGPAMTPLRTTDVRLEEKMTADAAGAALQDPVAFLLSIKEQIPLLSLNSLIVELVNELQARIMSSHVKMATLDRDMKKLAKEMKEITGIDLTDSEGDAEESDEPQLEVARKKKIY